MVWAQSTGIKANLQGLPSFCPTRSWNRNEETPQVWVFGGSDVFPLSPSLWEDGMEGFSLSRDAFRRAGCSNSRYPTL